MTDKYRRSLTKEHQRKHIILDFFFKKGDLSEDDVQ